MKKSRIIILIVSLMTSILLISGIGIYIFTEKQSNVFDSYEIYIFALIVIFGAIAFISAIKKNKEQKQGFPAEDELSNRIKYKAGYYSYLISMYMWLFIFLFKDKFPDIETMLGGGILLSALISFGVKFYIKKNFNEQQD